MKALRLSMLLLLALLVAPATMAATATNDRQWSDGALTWNDFQGVPNQLNMPSWASFELATAATQSAKAGTRSRYSIKAVALMHRNASWADQRRCDARRLRYHQLQFDLLEVMRRRLQRDINSGISGIETERRLKEYRADYLRRLAEIDTATNYGANDQRLQDWEYDVRRQLEDMGVPPVPQVKPNSFCYGIYGGVGAVFPTGGLKNQFKGNAIFQLGLTGGYNRFRLKADIAYGQPSPATDNIFKKLTTDGKDAQHNSSTAATFLGVGVQLGYAIIDTHVLTITPSVGGYYASYKWDVDNLEWSKDKDGKDVAKIVSTDRMRFSSFNWMASIDFDIKLHARVTNTPVLGGSDREQFVSSLRISPFVARAKHSTAVPPATGYLFGFTVAYSGLARILSF